MCTIRFCVSLSTVPETSLNAHQRLQESNHCNDRTHSNCTDYQYPSLNFPTHRSVPSDLPDQWRPPKMVFISVPAPTIEASVASISNRRPGILPQVLSGMYVRMWPLYEQNDLCGFEWLPSRLLRTLWWFTVTGDVSSRCVSVWIFHGSSNIVRVIRIDGLNIYLVSLEDGKGVKHYREYPYFWFTINRLSNSVEGCKNTFIRSIDGEGSITLIIKMEMVNLRSYSDVTCVGATSQQYIFSHKYPPLSSAFLQVRKCIWILSRTVLPLGEKCTKREEVMTIFQWSTAVCSAGGVKMSHSCWWDGTEPLNQPPNSSPILSPKILERTILCVLPRTSTW